ncbi:MAG: tyrosinase family protein, partial [Candidatus Saccharimonadales bacterium]
MATIALADGSWQSSPANAAQASLRTRKSVSSLTADSPDIVALKTAVAKMKDLPNTDGRNWLRQASIHGTFNGGFGRCQHGNWFFLPWHRAYLYFFEEIVRGLTGEEAFALPYWDWTKDHSLPALFWGQNNPLANPPRAQQPGSGRRPGLGPNTAFSADEIAQNIGQTVISQILAGPDFETFGGLAVDMPGQRAGEGELESTPHNFIHNWVGGDMGTGGSPYDPIFWLHHSNVDRLWAE